MEVYVSEYLYLSNTVLNISMYQFLYYILESTKDIRYREIRNDNTAYFVKIYTKYGHFI